jgi:AcrR family transcriptional regulator
MESVTVVPRRRLSSEQRRNQLLDTAEVLFSSAGYEATTMEDIARAAGVTRAVVYANFDVKEDLLRAGVERARAELTARFDRLRSSAEGLPPAELITQGGEIFFSLLEEAPSRWALMFAPSLAVSASTAKRIAQMRSATILQIVDIALLAQIQTPRENIEAVSYMISGVGEQLGRWWLTQPDVPRSTVVAIYRDFIINGLSVIVTDS